MKTAVYSSTDVANLYLAKGSAKSLHDMIVYQSQTIYPLWNNIADAVRLVLHHPWNLRNIWRSKGVRAGVCSLSTQGGEEPEREDLRPPSGGGVPGHLQVPVCFVFVCGFN